MQQLETLDCHILVSLTPNILVTIHILLAGRAMGHVGRLRQHS